MGNGKDPLGILTTTPAPQKKVADPLGILKKKDWVSRIFDGGEKPTNGNGLSGGLLGKAVQPTEREQLTNYLLGLKTDEEKKLSQPKAITTGTIYKKPENLSMPIDEKSIVNAQKKLGDIMYGEGEGWKDPMGQIRKGIIASDNMDDVSGYGVAQILTEKSLMPDGFDAKRALSSSTFSGAGKDNLTAETLRNRVDEYEKTVAPFRDINPQELTYLTKDKLYDAAIRAYANNNTNFKKQLEAAGIDINKEDISLSIGDNNAKRGQIMSVVLQNPDLHTFLEKENPDLIPALKDIQENLIYDNKDYGKVQIANEISRDMQSGGYNKIDPIFNLENSAKKTGDVTAEALYANDPKKLQFYRENKDDILNKLDAPSLFTGFAEAGKGFGRSILNTFTQPFTSPSKTMKEGWEKEASHVSADPKGLVKFLSDSGHALGFVASIGATGNVFGAVGLSPNAASMTSLGVGFLGDNLEQAKMKYPDSPVKQWTSALFNTGLFMAMGKNLFPAAKVEQALTKVQPGISKVIDNLASGSITREAARAELNTWGKKAIDIASEGLQKNLKVSAEMTGITILNKTLDRLMGMDDQTFQQFHPEGEEADTFKSMFLSNIIVNSMAAYGQNRAKNNIAKESIYEAATYPNRYRNVIESSEISKNVTDTKDMLDNLDYIVNLKKDLDARGLNEKQKKDYLFNALKSKVLNASKPQSPDATLTRQHSERIKNLEEINQGILEGKDADEVVTTEEQKIRDEQDNATEQQNKLVEQGHKAVKGLLEETDKDDKPKLKGIYRDIAKDNPMGFLQEIADQAFGMERVDGERVKSSSPVPELDLIPKYGADVVNTAKKLFPLEAEKPKLEDQVRELADENTPNESAGVSGSALKDVESTAKALEIESKNKPTIWEQVKQFIKDTAKKVGNKLGIISNEQHLSNFEKAKADWDKLSSREKKLKRADYELDDLHHTEGGYYKVGDSLIDLDLNASHLKLLLENNKFLNILNKLGVNKIHGENRPPEEMFAHYSDNKIHLNNNSAFENIRQVTNAMSHELGHHEWTKLTKEERDYVRSLPIETGMAKHYEAQEKNGGKQTSASLQEENFADYVMQYFQGKLYGDESLLNKIPTKLREMFDNKYSDLLKDNEHSEVAEAYHKAKADGTNPELVKAVEDLLGKAPTQYTEAATQAVKEVHSKNSELSKIGTEQEYAEYLKTIFPDSQVKNIMYHRSNAEFDKFDNSKLNKETGGLFDFTKESGIERYGKNEYPVLLNIKKVGKGFELKDGQDGVQSTEMLPNGKEVYSVPDASQIHILGNKADVEGFKKWKEAKAPTQYTEAATPKEQRGKTVKTKEASNEEPPLPKGENIVTYSGMTESERQQKIAEREGKSGLTDEQKTENDLADLAYKANKLTYSSKADAQSKLRQRVRAENAEAGFEKYKYDGVSVLKKRVKRKGGNKGIGLWRKVSSVNKDVGNQSIKKDGKPLRERSTELKNNFDDLVEVVQYLEVEDANGRKMSTDMLEAALQDVYDGIPSVQAENLLDVLEKALKEDHFPMKGDFTGKQVRLNDVLGVKSEIIGEPLTEDAIKKWLNDESDLSPEMEEILTNEFKNTLYEQFPEIEIEGTFSEPSTGTEKANGKSNESENAAKKAETESKIAELTEQRDRELTKAGKPEIAEMSLSDKDFAKLPAEEQNKYEEWEKKESKLRKLIDCLWKMK